MLFCRHSKDTQTLFQSCKTGKNSQSTHLINPVEMILMDNRVNSKDSSIQAWHGQ